MAGVKYNPFLWLVIFNIDQLSDPVHHTAPNSLVGTARGMVRWRWGFFQLATATQRKWSGNTGLALEEKSGLILSGRGMIPHCRRNESIVTCCFVPECCQTLGNGAAGNIPREPGVPAKQRRKYRSLQ